MENNSKKGIVIGILITVVVIATIYLILSFTNVVNFSSKSNSKDSKNGIVLPNGNSITLDMLIGTYTWSKNYTNEYGNNIKLNVTLVLNADGTATYNASDGASYEATRGTYKLESNKIVYTREYYNYPNQENSKFDDDNNKTEIFEIVNKDTLQNTFNNQVTELKKQENVSLDTLIGTYTWSKNYTNEYGNNVKLNVTLVLNADGTATYNASDGASYEATKGTYKLENNKIVYTREYYNYPNQENSKFDDDNNKTEKFDIIDKNTLQNSFNDQVTELKKQ